MRLYERLICTLPKSDDDIRGALVESVPVLCDNVAEYLYHGTDQEVWDVRTDFPNIAPPWESAFYEWLRPRWSNSNGRMVDLGCAIKCGLLVQSTTIDRDVTDAQIERMLPYMLMYYGRDKGLTTGQLISALGRNVDQNARMTKIRTQFGDEFVEQSKRKIREQLEKSFVWPKWGLSCAFAAEFPGHPARFTVRYSLPVLADGSQVDASNERTSIAMWPYVKIENESVESMDLRMHHIRSMGPSHLHVPFLAISLSHCKNVEVSDGPVIEPRARETRRSGLRRVKYKILHIESMRKVLRDAGAEEHEGAVRALHICRGHFKDYRERGLFGKLKGRFWWDQSMRGSATAGRIEKVYSVDAPNGV